MADPGSAIRAAIRQLEGSGEAGTLADEATIELDFLLARLDIRDILHGWEHRTWYAACEHYTRGQAKATVAWDEAEPFTALRSRRVWLTFREVTETDAEEGWLPDWSPGDKAWMECKRDAERAVAWWEVTIPRPGCPPPESSQHGD